MLLIIAGFPIFIWLFWSQIIIAQLIGVTKDYKIKTNKLRLQMRF